MKQQKKQTNKQLSVGHEALELFPAMREGGGSWCPVTSLDCQSLYNGEK